MSATILKFDNTQLGDEVLYPIVRCQTSGEPATQVALFKKWAAPRDTGANIIIEWQFVVSLIPGPSRTMWDIFNTLNSWATLVAAGYKALNISGGSLLTPIQKSEVLFRGWEPFVPADASKARFGEILLTFWLKEPDET